MRDSADGALRSCFAEDRFDLKRHDQNGSNDPTRPTFLNAPIPTGARSELAADWLSLSSVYRQLIYVNIPFARRSAQYQ